MTVRTTRRAWIDFQAWAMRRMDALARDGGLDGDGTAHLGDWGARRAGGAVSSAEDGLYGCGQTVEEREVVGRYRPDRVGRGVAVFC